MMDSKISIREKLDSGTLPLLGKSIIVGLLTGVVATAFRWVIALAESTAFAVYPFAAANPRWIWAVFAGLIALGLLICLIVRLAPMSNSSGIPQTKGVVTGQIDYCWWKVLIAKFCGSSVSTVCGLALGREGPAIQLGGCVGMGVGKKFARSRQEYKVLVASGAGAGLGTVLGAPLAGVMFAIEDMMHYFSPLILLCTLTSAVTSQFVAASVFGLQPIFHFALSGSIPLASVWVLILLGLVVGLCGVGYTKILLVSQQLYKKISGKPWMRLLLPFLLAGVLGLVLPEVLCGGEYIINTLDVSMTLRYLLLILAVKFVFFLICFDSGAPGGNLFPILVLGSLLGAVFGYFAIHYMGFAPELFANFIILAMAGYFAAIARTPITAIILLMEVTGSFDQLLALAVVCLIAYAVADLLKSPPVYDALLEARVAADSVNRTDEEQLPDNAQCDMEFMVQFGSPADGCRLQDLELPAGCRVGSVKRGQNDILPDENILLRGEDCLQLLADKKNEADIFKKMSGLTSVN